MHNDFPMRMLIFFIAFLAPIMPLSAQALDIAAARAVATEASQPGKIIRYTLSPDLYRKAHNRGRINFISQLASLFYSIFVFWVVLNRKIGNRFRDWAESVSRYRVVQTFVFVPLLVFTAGVLR